MIIAYIGVTMAMITCKNCDIEKSITEFLKNPQNLQAKPLQNCSTCRASFLASKKKRMAEETLPTCLPKRHRTLIPSSSPAPSSSSLSPIHKAWDDGSQETIERVRAKAARDREARGRKRGHTPDLEVEPSQEPNLEEENLQLEEQLPGFLNQGDWDLIQNFHAKLSEINLEYCPRCKEKWFHMKMKDGICRTCFRRDRGLKDGDPFLMSADNNMDPMDIPIGVNGRPLPELLPMEEMAIARCHPQMMVKRVRGCQYHYTGHCCTFMVNNVRFFETLPVIPEDIDIVVLQPKQNAHQDPRYRRQFERDFHVRRWVVEIWLKTLKEHHPDYRYITISNEKLSQLPLDGNVSDRVICVSEEDLIEEDQEHDEDLNQEGDVISLDEPNLETVFGGDEAPRPTSSMVLNLDIQETEIEQIQSNIRKKHRQLKRADAPEPEVRSTPIDEIGRKVRIYAMAFPSLFPRGVADWNEGRLRSVSLMEWGQHLLRYHDGRFGRHPRFRYLLFNQLMRARVRGSSTYYVNKDSELKDMPLDALIEALDKDDYLLNQIVRQGKQLPGTRPFWTAHSAKLQSIATQLHPLSASFITFSAADHQWDDLHRHLPRYEEFSTGVESVRTRIAFKNVQENPHIIAAYLKIRFDAFFEEVLKPAFKIVDWWNRWEWQARGSGHNHGSYWSSEAPEMKVDTEEDRKTFAEYWDQHIVAINPHIQQHHSLRNPCSLPFNNLENTSEQCASLLNTFQYHRKCTVNSCLRKNKKTNEVKCRYFFPRKLLEAAGVTMDIDGKSWKFAPRRNDERMNQCVFLFVLGWMANTDFQPATTLVGLVEYCAKYCSKPEKESKSYKDLQCEIIKHVNEHHPLLSFTAKLLNKLVGERDWSAQEISHILLGLPLVTSSRVVLTLDCRPEEMHKDILEVSEEGLKAPGRSAYQKYKARLRDHQKKLGSNHNREEVYEDDEPVPDHALPTELLEDHEALRNTTLLEWMKYWDHQKMVARPRAKPRIIHYYPRYKPDNADTYEDYCRVKMMLHHPFTELSDLLKIDGEQYGSFTDAYSHCCYYHIGEKAHVEEDFYDPIEKSLAKDSGEEVQDDENDWEQLLRNEPEDLRSNWEVLANRSHRNDLTIIENIDALGDRSIDRNYDWNTHVGTTLAPDFWEMAKQNRPNLALPPLCNPNTLNREQRLFYDTFVDHYKAILDGQDPPQLLINCDGQAGTGKTHTVLQTCGYLDFLANQQGLPSPVLRAAPTGVAAFNFIGRTLHGLFRLPIKDRPWAITPETLIGLQARFKDIKYLIIDEKSMIDNKVMGIIDERLREIFPAKSMEPFGGLNLAICGDFWQLPPVGGTPLFKRHTAGLPAIAIKGQTAYRAINKTIRLTQIMRQGGETLEMIQFRETLDQLRNDNLSVVNWEFLKERAACNLHPDEVASFDNALRLYFTNREVNEYNHEKLKNCGQPIKKIVAEHSGIGAKTATREKADNLSGEIDLCLGARVMLTTNLWVENGLVNGSQGKVRDIVWEEGKDPSKDLPLAIMVEFDQYKGPFFEDTNTVPIFTSTTKYQVNNQDCERTQFALSVAYAITIHKSQGLTLSKAVLNLEEKDFRPGLSYVGISRVIARKGLLFETSFDYERFKVQHGVTHKDRELDYAVRTRQCIN